MNSIVNLTSQQLRRAAGIKAQISSLETKLNQILGAPAPDASAPGKRRKMSAAARRKIAAAAKARWAKIKGRKVPLKPAHRTKGKMSPAVKAKLSAKMKALWAARKAAQKK